LDVFVPFGAFGSFGLDFAFDLVIVIDAAVAVSSSGSISLNSNTGIGTDTVCGCGSACGSGSGSVSVSVCGGCLGARGFRCFLTGSISNLFILCQFCLDNPHPS